MIVVKHNSPCYTATDFFLKEVETREEAFFEMRRFCEVNGITGTSTTVYEECGDGNKYCKVNMDGAEFRLFYSEKPECMEFKPLSEYPEKWRPYEGYYRDHPSELVYITTLYITYNEGRANCKKNFWYDELTAYFADLDKRKAGGG